MSDAKEQLAAAAWFKNWLVQRAIPSIRHIFSIVRLFVYARYSILAGAVLLGLGILPLFIQSPAVRAVYVLDSNLRMFFTTFLALGAAALVIITFRTTLCNASQRFDDPTASELWKNTPDWLWKIRRFSIWALGLPAPLACLWLTWAEASTARLLTEFGLGILSALVVMCLIHIATTFVLTPNLYDPRFLPVDFHWLFPVYPEFRAWQLNADSEAAKQRPARWSLSLVHRIAELFASVGMDAGFVHQRKVWKRRADGAAELTEELVLRPGHGALLLLTSGLVFVYFFQYLRVSYTHRYPDDGGWFGTLFFIIGLTMLMSCVLPGFAFFLDRFRIPTLLVLLPLILLLSFVNPHHEFAFAPQPVYSSTDLPTPSALADPSRPENSVTPTPTDNTFLDRPLTLQEVLDGWERRQANNASNRTFVIVTAAGGGIQASGWTTQVLRGLDEQTNGRFSKSLGLITSVSGGSTGTLFYLSQYPEIITADDATRRQLLDHVHTQATNSSIEAIGWGFLFPDALRCFGLLRDSTYDRGAVQEIVWQKRMAPMQNMGQGIRSGRPDWRLGHLAAGVQQGTLPAVVFNSYVIDTGQRVWMAPFTVRTKDSKRRPYDFVEYARAGGMQTRLSTAARLSATFPYVSPTCKPDAVPDQSATAKLLRNRHFGDGGYTDNESLLTALHLVEEIAKLAGQQAKRSIDRILLVRIAPFPTLDQLSEEEYRDYVGDLEKADKLKGSGPAIQGVAGPMIGLYHGRKVTQQERGDLELDWFEARFKKERINDKSNVLFKRVLLDFYLKNEQANGDALVVAPPLSWKLLESDKVNLELAWKGEHNQDKVKHLVTLLGGGEN